MSQFWSKIFENFFWLKIFAESSKNIYFDKWVFSHMFIHAVGITWYSIIICGKKSHDRISFVLIQAHLYVQNLIIDQPHFKSLVWISSSFFDFFNPWVIKYESKTSTAQGLIIRKYIKTEIFHRKFLTRKFVRPKIFDRKIFPSENFDRKLLTENLYDSYIARVNFV